MQTIQQQHAQAVYEAHILALKTLTDLLQRETDPVEQRRISAIILRTKPTPPKPADLPPAPPRPRAAKPALCSPPLLADFDDEEDDNLDLKGFTPADIDVLRHLMLVTVPPLQPSGPDPVGRASPPAAGEGQDSQGEHHAGSSIDCRQEHTSDHNPSS